MADPDRGERLQRVFAAYDRGDTDYLLGALVDPDARSQAIRLLAKLGDERAVDPIVRQLRVKDPVARRAAAIALGKMRATSATAALQETAQSDPDPAARGWALDSLTHLDIALARPMLVAALSDATWVVRRGAAFSLGEAGDTQDIDTLRAASRREPWYRRRVYRQAIQKLKG